MKELATWAGRSKFRYEGSVLDGIVLHFGASQVQKLSPEIWAQMMDRFAGCTVKVGTSRTIPPRDSLGEWLIDNVTRTAIASYVAPILLAEGYAERVNDDSSSLHFYEGIRLEPELSGIACSDGFSIYDQESGDWSTMEGIDGKELARLEREGKVKWKRIDRRRE